MKAAYVVARDLTKRYGDGPPAVDRASFDLAEGEMLALLGPSGCGKTTILRMIAGLIEPTSGSIGIGGREVAGLPVHRRNMGMVFQSYALLPHLTVAENVGFGLAMRRVPRAERRRRVEAVLAMVKLDGKGGRRITELSGGQQQRAAIARSLVIEPSLLLLDEPLSNLDAKLREELRGEIRDLQRRTGTTAIFVTHDQTEALAAADRIVVMSAGRIEQIGTPSDVFDRPATRFVAGFLGAGTFLDGVAEGATARVEGLGTVRLPEPRTGRVAVLLRPHRVDFVEPGAPSPDNAFPGTVETVIYTGELVALTVRIGAIALAVSRLARGRPLAPGDAVTVGWNASDAIILPGEGR